MRILLMILNWVLLMAFVLLIFTNHYFLGAICLGVVLVIPWDKIERWI